MEGDGNDHHSFGCLEEGKCLSEAEPESKIAEAVFEGKGECKNSLGIVPSKCTDKISPGNIQISPTSSSVPCLHSQFQYCKTLKTKISEMSNAADPDIGEYQIDPWEVSELHIQIHKLTEECADLKIQLSSYQEESYSLQVETDELKNKLSHGTKTWMERLKQLEEDLDDAKIAVLATEDVNLTLINQVKKLEKDCSDLEWKARDYQIEAQSLALDLESCQSRLKSKEEEVDVIRGHSEEYIENWLSKEKLNLEDKIRQLEDNLVSLTHTNSLLQCSKQLDYMDLNTSSSLQSELSEVNTSHSSNGQLNSKSHQGAGDCPQIFENYKSKSFNDSLESLHSEISTSIEVQQEVLVPIFGGVGRCDVWTQSDLFEHTDTISIITQTEDFNEDVSSFQIETCQAFLISSQCQTDISEVAVVYCQTDANDGKIVSCQTDIFEVDSVSLQTDIFCGEPVSCQTDAPDEDLIFSQTDIRNHESVFCQADVFEGEEAACQTENNMESTIIFSSQSQTDINNMDDFTCQTEVFQAANIFCQTDMLQCLVVSCQTEFADVAVPSVNPDSYVLEHNIPDYLATDKPDLYNADFNQNMIFPAQTPGNLAFSGKSETEPSTAKALKIRWLGIRDLIYFEIGLLMLALFLGLTSILYVLIPLWWNNELFLPTEVMDISNAAVKYGRLEHLDRPII